MKTEQITVANLKCDGCANTIRHKLSEIPGVQHVKVDNDNDLVIVEHNDDLQKEVLTKKLAGLGYPEATEENGLLSQIKSYASCMIGRILPEQNEK